MCRRHSVHMRKITSHVISFGKYFKESHHHFLWKFSFLYFSEWTLTELLEKKNKKKKGKENHNEHIPVNYLMSHQRFQEGVNTPTQHGTSLPTAPRSTMLLAYLCFIKATKWNSCASGCWWFGRIYYVWCKSHRLCIMEMKVVCPSTSSLRR